MYKRSKSIDTEKKEQSVNIQNTIIEGKKKWVRYEEGAKYYSMGIHSFQKLAQDANAVYHVNRIVLVNTEKVDEYMELMCADEDTRY